MAAATEPINQPQATDIDQSSDGAGQDQDAAAAIASFWAGFHLFPTKVERAVFDRGWLLAAIALLPFLLRLAISLAADSLGFPQPLYGADDIFTELNYQNPWVWTQDSLNQWVLILAILGMLPALWAYRRWMARVPVFFHWLLENGRLAAKNGDTNGPYLAYLQDYQRVLSSHKGRFVFLIFFIAVLIIWHFAGEGMGWVSQRTQYLVFDCNLADSPGQCAAFRTELLRFFLPYSLGYFLWTIMLAFACWPIFATGRQLKKLTDEFVVKLQPSHPDKCGGLSPIGDFSFNMVLPLVMGFVIVGLIAVVSLLLQAVGGTLEVGSVTYTVPWITVTIISVGALLVLTPLVALAFFSPLWDIHLMMAGRKRALEDDYAAKVTQLVEDAQLSLAANQSPSLAKEQLETLQVIERGQRDFRSWPFRRTTLISLFGPQIAVTLVGFLSGLKELLEW